MRCRSYVALVLAVAAALLLAAGAPGVSGSLLARAQAAWATRPFDAYRANIIHQYQLGDFLISQHRCTMTVEVRAGAAPRLIAGDCPEALSVEAILARFEPYADAPVASRWCGYGGCRCALSTLVMERNLGAAFPRRIARDWRDATVGAGPGWALLAGAPAPLRATVRGFAERRNQCPPGTGNHTLDLSPIYREEFTILSVEPLP
jgi:hypothetical protein